MLSVIWRHFFCINRQTIIEVLRWQGVRRFIKLKLQTIKQFINTTIYNSSFQQLALLLHSIFIQT